MFKEFDNPGNECKCHEVTETAVPLRIMGVFFFQSTSKGMFRMTNRICREVSTPTAEHEFISKG